MSLIKLGHSALAHREDIEDHVLRQRVRADERLKLLRVNGSAAVHVNSVEELAEVRVRHHLWTHDKTALSEVPQDGKRNED